MKKVFGSFLKKEELMKQGRRKCRRLYFGVDPVDERLRL
jgi:hypothetical protein